MTETIIQSPAERAEAWRKRCITAADFAVVERAIDDAVSEARYSLIEDEGDDDGAAYMDGWGVLRRSAVDILRTAANHYPHPINGALFDAAFRQMLDNLVGEDVTTDTFLTDITTKILEQPDALLC